MPPLPVIPNVFRCAFEWSEASGQHAANVMHFRSSILTSAGLEALLNTAWVAGQIHPCSSSAGIDQIRITKLDGSSATTIYPETNARWKGGTAADFSPASSVILSLRTTLRGRSYRGRIFLPFAAEFYIANGALDATEQGLRQTDWSNFLGAMALGTAPLVVASYLHSSAQDVASVLVERELATQRRRQSRLR